MNYLQKIAYHRKMALLANSADPYIHQEWKFHTNEWHSFVELMLWDAGASFTFIDEVIKEIEDSVYDFLNADREIGELIRQKIHRSFEELHVTLAAVEGEIYELNDLVGDVSSFVNWRID